VLNLEDLVDNIFSPKELNISIDLILSFAEIVTTSPILAGFGYIICETSFILLVLTEPSIQSQI
jgi:hypothetical protein